MRRRGKLMAIAAGAALLSMTALTLPASAVAAAGRSGRPALSQAPALAGLTPPGRGAPAMGASSATQSCGYVRTHLAAYARAGARAVGCMQPVRRLTRSVARPAPGEGVRPDALSNCDDTPPQEWLLVDRFDECMQQQLIYYVWNTTDGVLIASATVNTDEDIETAVDFSDWDEDVSISMSNPQGNAAYLNILVAWASLCFAPTCSYEPNGSAFGGSWASLSPGGSQTGELVMSAPIPSGGTVSTTMTDWLITYNPATTVPYTNTMWTDPYPVRCDDQIGSADGCVFPAYTPNLVLSESVYGAAAAMILWAQVNQGGWGLPYGAGPPLTRLASQAQANQNRSVICDSTWVPDPVVPQDSCDEYPFASTYQSGGTQVSSGSQCAEVLPVNQNGTWTVTDLNGIVQAPCTRGHVPLPQNTAVGSALGNFYVANRILNGDPFTVQVTN
jgi:hypothetical protein